MHILFLSQYFPPEMGAPAARVHELAREWRRSGHRVTVLTAFPNHPDGRIPASYTSRFRHGTCREVVDGIDVVRTWLYPAPNRFPIERILNYSSFFVSALLRGIWIERPDVVIGTSPQLLAPLAAWGVARRFRVPFVFEVRDLWPESLPASGISSVDSPLYRVLAGLARFLYRSADLIVPVTDRFCPAIAPYLSNGRMLVVENGVDTDLFHPGRDGDQIRRRYGLEDRFVVSYIGTIGYAHGLPTALDAADVLRARLPDTTLLIVGDGAERRRLEDAAAARGLTNVLFAGQQARAQIPAFISASDACLVMLRRSELFDTVLPSKLLEFMGCARPSIVAVGGLARQIVETGDAGIAIEPENAAALVEAITRLHDDGPLGRRLGSNGRQYILDRFTRRAKARVYLDALQQLALA